MQRCSRIIIVGQHYCDKINRRYTINAKRNSIRAMCSLVEGVLAYPLISMRLSIVVKPDAKFVVTE
jgi:hypothetical protein